MDKTALAKEASDEVARESLIAISNALPEKAISPKRSPQNLKGEKLVRGQSLDSAEKYRSELISISYSDSPDAKDSPVS